MNGRVVLLGDAAFVARPHVAGGERDGLVPHAVERGVGIGPPGLFQAGAHGYMLSSLTLPPSQWDVADPLFKRATNLLAVCTTGAGYDPIDVDACTRRGIRVVHTPLATVEAVAEHAVALMLAVAVHFSWQIATLKPNDQADCLAKFKANAGIGWLLLLAMVVGHLH